MSVRGVVTGGGECCWRREMDVLWFLASRNGGRKGSVDEIAKTKTREYGSCVRYEVFKTNVRGGN